MNGVKNMDEMSYDIPLSNHLAVSELSATDTLSNNSLFLVSEENSSTRTGFITRSITYARAKKALDRDFSLTKLTQQFNELCAITYPVISGLETNYVSCENIGNLYIISSLYQSDGNITSCFGYRLSAGMDYVFKHTKFDRLSVNNLYATTTNIETAKITNLCAENTTVSNLNVTNNATFNDNVTFNKTIIVNGKSLDAAYRIHEFELSDQNKIEISSDTVNVVYLTQNTSFDDSSHEIDIVIKGMTSDTALDSELLIHKTSQFITTAPDGSTDVKLRFVVDDGTGSYMPDVDFVTPNFLSVDNSGSITDSTDITKLNDTDEATYLYLISQLTTSDPKVGNKRFYISRQYLNSIQN